MVCIDSHVAIWAVQRRASPGQEFLLERAAAYLAGLGTPAALPVVALHEALVDASPALRAAWLGALVERFEVWAFDVHAAEEAATLEWEWRRRVGPQERVGARDRYDIMILGTALRYGATVLVSHDERLARIAETVVSAGRLNVEQLPG